MTVRTLSRWVDRLLKGPAVIECPHVKIIGYDHDPPVFTGSGSIEIGADTRMHFVMHGMPSDGAEALRKFVDAQKSPYDVFRQFRVNAVGYDGTQWSGGWTSLTLGEIRGNVWRLSGPIAALHTQVEGRGVVAQSGVELVYDQTLRVPLSVPMVKTVRIGENEVLRCVSAGSEAFDVLGTRISFYRSAEREHVWAVAETSDELPHPHLENWLSEPLSLLLGDVVSPRLKCRNLGDGRALISLHSSSAQATDSLLACVLREDPLGAGQRFWGMYCDILTVVAKTIDAKGQLNFEAHPLTRYYWEIIQASKGSNWVLCMTLASTVEGILKMMFSEEERKAEWLESDLDGMKEVVAGWRGDNNLRSAVMNYLNGFKKKSIPKTLKPLVEQGVITADQVDAWSRIRNAAMHGEMVLPWSDEEREGRIRNLIELTHGVSRAYIKRELDNLNECGK
jgi:hypothetical protein